MEEISPQSKVSCIPPRMDIAAHFSANPPLPASHYSHACRPCQRHNRRHICFASLFSRIILARVNGPLSRLSRPEFVYRIQRDMARRDAHHPYCRRRR